MSQELRDKILEDNLVNRKLIINGGVDDCLIDLAVMQILKFNEEDAAIEEEDNKLAEQFRTFKREDDPIKIYINSPGGKVISSLSLISAIESSKTPVYTYCLGQAASAAAIILLAGHKRFCQKYSTAMIHEMSAGVQGTIQDHKEFIIDSDILQKMYDEIITKNTKIKHSQLKDVYEHKKDWTFTSFDMLKYKIVDELF
jgi:ATP-dependent Clp protease protease subunit